MAFGLVGIELDGRPSGHRVSLMLVFLHYSHNAHNSERKMQSPPSFPTNVFMNQYGMVVEATTEGGVVEITRHNRAQIYVLSPTYYQGLQERIRELEAALAIAKKGKAAVVVERAQLDVGDHQVQIECRQDDAQADAEISIVLSKKRPEPQAKKAGKAQKKAPR